MLVESQAFQNRRHDEFKAGYGLSRFTDGWTVEIKSADSKVLVRFPIKKGSLLFESYVVNRMCMTHSYSAVVLETGVATKFVMRSIIDEDMWLSGDVGEEGSNAEMKFNSATMISGFGVSLDSFGLYY
jgi:hypothetical protein